MYDIQAPIEIVYTIPFVETEEYFTQPVSLFTQSILETSPQAVLGSTTLVEYNVQSRKLCLTATFKQLLSIMIEIGELDPQILNVKTLAELNMYLQKEQGPCGGFLRKVGAERWQLEDSLAKQSLKSKLISLFRQLGFIEGKIIEDTFSVHHVIIFGARSERVEQRILETIGYLENNIIDLEQVYLLGSNRKLIEDELNFLTKKISLLPSGRKEFWAGIFSDPLQAIESNAMIFLWEFLLTEELKVRLNNRCTVISVSKVVGQEQRPGVHTTTEEWLKYYDGSREQKIFAYVEQPYQRMSQQMVLTILSDAKMASREEFLVRLNNTKFYLASQKATVEPLVSVYLDEIARTINTLTVYLDYLDNR